MVVEFTWTLAGVGASYTGLALVFAALNTFGVKLPDSSAYLTSAFTVAHSIAYQCVFWSM